MAVLVVKNPVQDHPGLAGDVEFVVGTGGEELSVLVEQVVLGVLDQGGQLGFIGCASSSALMVRSMS